MSRSVKKLRNPREAPSRRSPPVASSDFIPQAAVDHFINSFTAWLIPDPGVFKRALPSSTSAPAKQSKAPDGWSVEAQQKRASQTEQASSVADYARLPRGEELAGEDVEFETYEDHAPWLDKDARSLGPQSTTLVAHAEGHAARAGPDRRASVLGAHVWLAAAGTGCDSMVVEELLERGAAVDLADATGRTPLMRAATAGQTEIVVTLISRGANVNHASKRRFTPIHGASLAGDLDIVAVLLRNDANVNAKTSDGTTPLMLACRTGSTDVVALLVGNGADPLPRRRDGWSALGFALDGGHGAVVEFLVHVLESRVCKRGDRGSGSGGGGRSFNDSLPDPFASDADVRPTAEDGLAGTADVAAMTAGEVAAVLLTFRCEEDLARSHPGFDIDCEALACAAVRAYLASDGPADAPVPLEPQAALFLAAMGARAATAEAGSVADLATVVVNSATVGTLAHCAVISGRPRCLQELLQAGASLHAQTSDGLDLFALAAAGPTDPLVSSKHRALMLKLLPPVDDNSMSSRSHLDVVAAKHTQTLHCWPMAWASTFAPFDLQPVQEQPHGRASANSSGDTKRQRRVSRTNAVAFPLCRCMHCHTPLFMASAAEHECLPDDGSDEHGSIGSTSSFSRGEDADHTTPSEQAERQPSLGDELSPAISAVGRSFISPYADDDPWRVPTPPTLEQASPTPSTPQLSCSEGRAGKGGVNSAPPALRELRRIIVGSPEQSIRSALRAKVRARARNGLRRHVGELRQQQGHGHRRSPADGSDSDYATADESEDSVHEDGTGSWQEPDVGFAVGDCVWAFVLRRSSDARDEAERFATRSMEDLLQQPSELEAGEQEPGASAAADELSDGDGLGDLHVYGEWVSARVQMVMGLDSAEERDDMITLLHYLAMNDENPLEEQQPADRTKPKPDDPPTDAQLHDVALSGLVSLPEELLVRWLDRTVAARRQPCAGDLCTSACALRWALTWASRARLATHARPLELRCWRRRQLEPEAWASKAPLGVLLPKMRVISSGSLLAASSSWTEAEALAEWTRRTVEAAEVPEHGVVVFLVLMDQLVEQPVAAADEAAAILARRCSADRGIEPFLEAVRRVASEVARAQGDGETHPTWGRSASFSLDCEDDVFFWWAPVSLCSQGQAPELWQAGLDALPCYLAASDWVASVAGTAEGHTRPAPALDASDREADVRATVQRLLFGMHSDPGLEGIDTANSTSPELPHGLASPWIVPRQAVLWTASSEEAVIVRREHLHRSLDDLSPEEQPATPLPPLPPLPPPASPPPAVDERAAAVTPPSPPTVPLAIDTVPPPRIRNRADTTNLEDRHTARCLLARLQRAA